MIGDVQAPVVIGSDSLVIVKVPDGASAGELWSARATAASETWNCDIGIPIAENLHPVTNPAVDRSATSTPLSAVRAGQKVPVAVYRIDLNFNMRPFINDMMNADRHCRGPDGLIYISSRFDGMVYQVTPNGNMSVFVEGMGVATGICFRSTRQSVRRRPQRHDFQNQPDRQIFVFATLEPSIAAYHLAWGPDQHLYVSGPDDIELRQHLPRADNGDVEIFYRGLGRPQGMAFDAGTISTPPHRYMGRKGVVRITPDRTRRSFPLGARHRRAGVFAFPRHDRGDDERDLPRGCGHSRLSAVLNA